MKLKILSILFILTFFILTASTVSAGGATFTNEYTQVVQTELKSLIFFDAKKETLIESMTFNLNPLIVGNFAWVIATPTKPEVEILKNDVLNDWEALTSKNFSKDNLIERLIYFDIIEQKNYPIEVFSRPIDIFDHKVFGPPDSFENLEKWANEIGYLLPKSAYPLLKEYEKKNWYFLAMEVNALHIEYSATDSLRIYGAHTYPVKLTFETDKIIYPMKLASIGDDLDSENIPFSFDYGQTSENILGEKDEIVDKLLGKQSINKFPRLPVDFMNVKVDLSVITDNKVDIPGFNIIFADKVTNKDLALSLPDKSLFLTRMYIYKPKTLLNDIIIEKSTDQKRVNPRIRKSETLIRILIFAGLTLGSTWLFWIRKVRIKTS